AVSDLSGVAGGRIELRGYHGRGDWRALPTALRGGRLHAELSDDLDGAYELRARATDGAGNAGVGYGGVRTLPVRAATRLAGHLLVRARRARPGCKPAKAARCRTVATVRRQAARVARGGQVVLRATATTAAGRPLAGAEIAATLVSADGRETGLPALRTDAAGAVATVLTARRSATVRLRYAGDGRHRASEAAVELRVPAQATIAAGGPAVRAVRQLRRKAARGPWRAVAVAGRVVRFRGRVLGGAVPRAGKLVEVQAHFRGRWRTISAVRSDRRGRWSFRYRFGASPRTATYRMRARVPAEAGYPFAAGTSRPLRVTVPGARR
ncbi:MAG: hypothetical protein GXY03_02440, partial [Solirubrobacterales bacterium]|nr:hypothetical protein [Solirubrobacterales bacterium]